MRLIGYRVALSQKRMAGFVSSQNFPRSQRFGATFWSNVLEQPGAIDEVSLIGAQHVWPVCEPQIEASGSEDGIADATGRPFLGAKVYLAVKISEELFILQLYYPPVAFAVAT